MSEFVEEEAELHLVDTRQLVEEAKKLKEAQRIKQQNNKITKELTSSGSPISFGGDTPGALPKSERKRQTRKGAITGQKTNNEFNKMKKKIIELEKKQKKTEKDSKNLRDELFDKFNLGNDILTTGSVSGAVTGIAAKFGPLGIAIAGIISALLPGFMTQYERGGIFSTKLPITQQEKTINDIDYVVDVASGVKFLTSDLRIAQKAPETSNTQNLRYEHIRYVSQENGN